MKRRRTTAALAAALAAVIATAGCGSQDRAAVDDETSNLSSEVRRIVANARTKVADRVDLNADVLTSAVTAQIPSEPWGHLLAATVPPETGRPEVSFALDGKVDGIGPGNTTHVLRMCVTASFLGPSSLDSTITDADCSTLPAGADVVKYEG